MAAIRFERFIWRTTKGLSVDNHEASGEPLFGADAPKKRHRGLARPVQPSVDLAAIIGSAPLLRSQVVSKIWDHIRKNNLQNPQNKREILADDKLKKIFGKDRCSMFEMNKHLSNHLK